jgi:hypothetical protein
MIWVLFLGAMIGFVIGGALGYWIGWERGKIKSQEEEQEDDALWDRFADDMFAEQSKEIKVLEQRGLDKMIAIMTAAVEIDRLRMLIEQKPPRSKKRLAAWQGHINKALRILTAQYKYEGGE